MDNFTFDPKKHVYTLDGKPLQGVTSVLSVIAKPALIQWAANMACDHIKENWERARKSTHVDEPQIRLETLWEVIEEARKAHTRKKDKAATQGTDTHAEIEKYVKQCINEWEGRPLQAVSADSPALNSFICWAVENKITFIESEKRMYSRNLWLAGTCDLTLEMNGKRYLADVKTSNGLYPEHFYQCAAYRMMLEEHGIAYDGSLIIRIDKKTAKLETFERYDYETDKKAFLGALEIYRANETYKSNYRK